MKILFNTQTQEILPYPRNDDSPIVGLDSRIVILNQIETSPPDYDSNSQVITSNYIIDLEILEYRQEWIVQEKPPQPNWDMFNLQMMSSPRFNQVYSQCLNTLPIIATALPTAIDQITTKGLSLFTLVWAQFCLVGGATAEDKATWGNLAHENNLPIDFIEVLTR
jgi:hypothetical protein